MPDKCIQLSFSLLFLFCGAVTSQSDYVVPPVEIQALKPVGVRAAIPDRPGINLFAFNGIINNKINSSQMGDISGEEYAPKDGRWIFEDLKAVVNVGDVINYWVFIQFNDFGYRKENLHYSVEKLYSPSDPWPGENNNIPNPPNTTPKPQPEPNPPPSSCNSSPTTINGGQEVCAGQLIFEETFATLDKNRWTVESRLPNEDQENPFVYYSNDPNTVSVQNNRLRIKPGLLQNVPPFSEDDILTGTLDLFASCTGSEDQCAITASGSNILPPVVSGRISSKRGFTFKYGTIDVRAKVPIGDWLYPELFLQPANSKYGTEGYSSGMIRIGMVRGNVELRDLVNDHNAIDSQTLYAGIVLDQFNCHYKGQQQFVSKVPLGNNFHTYSLTWRPDSISLSIDGLKYGTILKPNGGFVSYASECTAINPANTQRWAKGTGFAPFDQEFYITLGVGAGSVTEFPDNIVTGLGKRKPWNNLSSKAKIRFWQESPEWLPTWTAPSLLVESVRVWAL